jgi:hypothetical protein
MDASPNSGDASSGLLNSVTIIEKASKDFLQIGLFLHPYTLFRALICKR